MNIITLDLKVFTISLSITHNHFIFHYNLLLEFDRYLSARRRYKFINVYNQNLCVHMFDLNVVDDK